MNVSWRLCSLRSYDLQYLKPAPQFKLTCSRVSRETEDLVLHKFAQGITQQPTKVHVTPTGKQLPGNAHPAAAVLLPVKHFLCFPFTGVDYRREYWQGHR